MRKKVQAQQKVYYAPSVQPVQAQASFTVHKSLFDLTPTESITYLEQLIDELTQKQKRERAYLDRRAGRGTCTPTDEAYERDQVLENKLLGLLNDLFQAAKENQGLP